MLVCDRLCIFQNRLSMSTCMLVTSLLARQYSSQSKILQRVAFIWILARPWTSRRLWIAEVQWRTWHYVVTITNLCCWTIKIDWPLHPTRKRHWMLKWISRRQVRETRSVHRVIHSPRCLTVSFTMFHCFSGDANSLQKDCHIVSCSGKSSIMPRGSLSQNRPI